MEDMRKLMETVAPLFQEAETGDQVDKTVAGHVDDEKDMMMKQLYQMGMYCVELYKMMDTLPDNTDFPHWWQSKLVKANDYIGAAKHYLEGELEAPQLTPSVEQSEPDDLDPSGVS